jgi:hypothetical protein
MRVLSALQCREGLYQSPSLVVNEGSSWNLRRVAVNRSIGKHGVNHRGVLAERGMSISPWFSVILCGLCVELFGFITEDAEKSQREH